ncbi:hypothetical protein SESBI_03575 [Sesbania bispinosa]|nr:hypothetical protein SESBI_03575 [Sesbania bispinosa]
MVGKDAETTIEMEVVLDLIGVIIMAGTGHLADFLKWKQRGRGKRIVSKFLAAKVG